MLEKIYTHSMFTDMLDAQSTIVDLGANIGQFAGIMADRFKCRVVALEPSPGPFGKIPRGGRIDPHNLAVAGAPGEVMLNISTNSEASSLGKADGFDYVDQIAVRAITLQDVITLAGSQQIQLLKLDIEGSEIDVLGVAPPETLRKFDQITVEFHDFCGITPRPVVERVIAHVAAAGFHVFTFDRHQYRNADVLFVNKSKMGAMRRLTETTRFWALPAVRSLGRRVTGR